MARPDYAEESDSLKSNEPALNVPSDARLGAALRHATKAIFETGNREELTVKRIRAAAEEELGFDDDRHFYKTAPEWDKRSKDIIKETVAALENNANFEESSVSTPQEQLKIRKPAVKPAPQKRKAPITSTAFKQRTTRKREEKSESVDLASDSLSDAPSDIESVRKPRRKKRKVEENDPGVVSNASSAEVTPKAHVQTDDVVDSEDDNGPHAVASSPTKAPAKIVDESESEMSVVLDESPPPKSRKRQTKLPPGSPSKAKASKATKAAAKVKTGPEDPEEAEIKRLQGWLIKCGIRKLWHKELAAYDTPKAKISHLKRMLKDAGMDGRYSAEKASRIKEQRELAADLEAVQAGAKLWGHDKDGEENESEEGGSGEKRPKRRLAKGFKELDFLGSDGGEETD
ncbi:hypothetical protein B0A49_11890 [Cryomyces minteri]|uniref:Transcriptional regulator n=1 Tax=Cryomyces minteri TaxID=331657 RepID=A0A4U0VQR4_9PEZI|nr:hypothetical protein B0A49_11890 [Cryomyces minteri]